MSWEVVSWWVGEGGGVLGGFGYAQLFPAPERKKVFVYVR